MAYTKGTNAKWADMVQVESFPVYLEQITTGAIPVVHVRADSIRGGYFHGYTATTTTGVAVKTTWPDRKIGLWHRA